MSDSKYDNYSVEELASDDDFINWCLSPDDKSNLFWRHWKQRSPERIRLVTDARRSISLLQEVEKIDVQSAMKKDIWSHVSAQIKEEQVKKKEPTSSYVGIGRISAVAASFMLLFLMYTLVERQVRPTEWTQLVNDTESKKGVELPDGSEVLIYPHSYIEYSSSYGDRQREVILHGEAFFDVTRDTSKPFLVYANKTITKVLGTSFLVKAIPDKSLVDVEVTSGSVAVMTHINSHVEGVRPQLVFKKGKVEIPKPNYKVKLKPNEKFSINHESKAVAKSIVAAPKLLDHETPRENLDFKDEPVTRVFQALESAYGVNIEYDIERLDYCLVTSSLDDSPLFTKLDIICAALNLKYEQKNAIIYVDGKGCH